MAFTVEPRKAHLLKLLTHSLAFSWLLVVVNGLGMGTGWRLVNLYCWLTR